MEGTCTRDRPPLVLAIKREGNQDRVEDRMGVWGQMGRELRMLYTPSFFSHVSYQEGRDDRGRREGVLEERRED